MKLSTATPLLVSIAFCLGLPLCAQQSSPQGMGDYGMPHGSGGLVQPKELGPDPSYRPMQRGAWQDGFNAAQQAHDGGHRMLPQLAAKYRKPPVSGDTVATYRDAFKQGYNSWLRHHGGSAPAPSPAGVPTGM